jgi:hypothetical protein
MQVMVYPDGVVKYTRRRHTMPCEEDYSISEEILEQICAEGFGALLFPLTCLSLS